MKNNFIYLLIKQSPVIALALLVFFIAIAIRVFILLEANLVYDDFFITLRVAKNFVSGNGLVYNLNEYIYPVTSIFYVLVCAIFVFFFGEGAIFGLRLLGCIADSLSAVILLLLIISVFKTDIKSNIRYYIGLFGALTYSTISSIVLVNVQGMETPIYILCIASCFYFYFKQHYKLVMLLAFIAVMIRPDGILLFAAILITEIINKKRIDIKSVLFFIVPLIVYLLILYIYYGTIIPQPVTAKSQLYSSFFEQWDFFLKKFFFSPKTFILGILFITGCYHIIKRRTALVVLIWSFIYAGLFASLTAWWAWYIPPFIFSYLFIISFGLHEQLVKLKSKKLIFTPVIIISLLFPIVLSIDTVIKVYDYKKFINPYFTQTKEIAFWLDKNVEQHEKVLLEPLGLIGYLAFENTFSDYPGLASKEVTNSLSKLGRKVYGSPVDFEAARQVINDLSPAALILREDEFNLLKEKGIVDNYKLELISSIDSFHIPQNPVTQNMFILKKK